MRVPATVPGAVQLDWARGQGWPPHTRGTEPLRYQGLEDCFWNYRTRLPEISLGEGEEPWLVLEDIDHLATVRRNGEEVASGGGCGQRVEVPLSPYGAGDELEVVLHPAPKEEGQTGRGRARRTTKAAVSYGWDFHPELIPLGIAGAAVIERRPTSHLGEVLWRARLSPDLKVASWSAEILCRGQGMVEARLHDPEGALCWEGQAEAGADGRARLTGQLVAPRLWWPRGHGAQDRYCLRCTLTPREGGRADQVERWIGFRRVRLRMAPGQWEEPSTFPKSRSQPPMCLEVNGRRVFAKGANLVGPDIFPGLVGEERWRGLVERAAQAHMNLLRVWGGSGAPSEAFYEACDRLGVMVVQEFPLACNEYPDDPEYLSELERCAVRLVSRLSPRPCLAVWSGGNELFNAWSGMTDQSHALRLLASLTWNLDPETPFLPTMPVEGVGHGYYLFRDPKGGTECFSMFQRSRNTAYTEFGVPCPSDPATVASIVPAEEIWPPRAGGAWKMHSGSEAWDVEPSSYLCQSTIEHYWGPQETLESLLDLGCWLSTEGLKAIIEECRRQRPFCGWSLVWCLNEPWPTIANQSLIAYPDRPKPSYHAVREAMRPTVVSARLSKFQWSPGEWFSADLFLLHDGREERTALEVEVRVRSGAWTVRLLEWQCPAGPGDSDLPGPTVRVLLPPELGDDLILELRCSDPSASNRYRLATRRPAEGADPAGRPRGLNA